MWSSAFRPLFFYYIGAVRTLARVGVNFVILSEVCDLDFRKYCFWEISANADMEKTKKPYHWNRLQKLQEKMVFNISQLPLSFEKS